MDVKLVRMLATVKNLQGQLVGGLEKSDFTVTDNGGATGSRTQPVTVTAPSTAPTITSVTGATNGSSRNKTATVRWTGTAATYDVYRNGALRASAVAGTSYVDALGKYTGTRSYTYRVCVAGGTTSCSADVAFTY